MMMFFHRILIIFFISFLMLHRGISEMKLPSEVKLNNVYMGENAPFAFLVSNTGHELTVISKIIPSCSCVIIDSFVGNLPAQGNLLITGFIETSNRLGPIKKNLRIYQKGKIFPTTVTLILNTVVFPKEHLSTAGRDMFAGTCAVCHINQGIGKTSESLYRSNCAICHGISLKHSNLNLSKLENMDIASFSKILDQPSKSHGKGFSKVLTQEQLVSLLNFFGKKSPPFKAPSTGQEIYAVHCSDCHGLRRGGPIGPPLSKDVLSDFSAQRTRNILLNNAPVLKISHQDILSAAEIEFLIQFLHDSPLQEE